MVQRKVDWKSGRGFVPKNGTNQRLIIFIYTKGDDGHPKILHGDRVKVFDMLEIPSRKYTKHKVKRHT